MSHALTITHKTELSAQANAALVVLADVSLSMSGLVPSLGVSKWQEMRRALGVSLGERRDWRLYAFDDEVREAKTPEALPRPRGTTDTALALHTAGTHNPEQVLVVTDGYPDSQAAALEAAEALGWTRIDVLYIGPKELLGAVEFCRLLARNGGQVMSSERDMLPAMTLLLGDGKGDAISL